MSRTARTRPIRRNRSDIETWRRKTEVAFERMPRPQSLPIGVIVYRPEVSVQRGICRPILRRFPRKIRQTIHRHSGPAPLIIATSDQLGLRAIVGRFEGIAAAAAALALLFGFAAHAQTAPPVSSSTLAPTAPTGSPATGALAPGGAVEASSITLPPVEVVGVAPLAGSGIDIDKVPRSMASAISPMSGRRGAKPSRPD
jgi:hypothetical protein